MKSKLTPMMRQYFKIKAQHKDVILFFQLGEFYETFFEDAELAARELDIVLTKRDEAPMAGVPIKKAHLYINRLLKKGYKVAICDQLQDPEEARGVVERDVVRIVTPGTVLDEEALERGVNNYIASLFAEDSKTGLAVVELSTGEFRATELFTSEELKTELSRLQPAELVIPRGTTLEELLETLERRVALTEVEVHYFKPDPIIEHFNLISLDGLGLTPLAGKATGGLLRYLKETQKEALSHLSMPSFYSISASMNLDPFTQRNLELMRELRSGGEQGTLLSVLNKTVTGMGERLLRKYILSPLVDRIEIEKRLDFVELLFEHGMLRTELREILKKIYDIERLAGRLGSKRVTPRDLLSLKQSLEHLPQLLQKLKEIAAGPQPQKPAVKMNELLTTLEGLNLEDLAEMLSKAIRDDAPFTLKEGNIIKEGFDEHLDALKEQERVFKRKILELEARERERTHIPSLKVGYNTVFGYYLEVTKVHAKRVPPDYIRKQTLVNAERYVTPELKEYEEKILSAQEKSQELEYELFCKLRETIAERTKDIQKLAHVIAQLDVFASLAEVAKLNNYCRPSFTEGRELLIKEGRHPVVEVLQGVEGFVPNDAHMAEDEILIILTGPNMSGKCLRGDSLVFTDQGIVPIAELAPADGAIGQFNPIKLQVRGINGVEPASHFYYGGCQRTLKITTRLGYELEGTLEHPLWVRDASGREGWKRLDEITPNDYIAIAREIDLWGDQVEITFKETDFDHRVKRYRLPRRLNRDLAYLMGLLIGDGTLTYTHSYCLSTADPFIRDEFSRINRELFGYEVKAKANGKDFVVSSLYLRSFLAHLGLDYVDACRKVVPHSILRAPKEIVTAFSQGLFDTDGYAEKRYGNVALATCSSTLASQVQILLLNYGIISSIKVKKTKANDSYQLSIFGENAIKFYQEIGFRLARKQARSALTTDLRMPNVDSIPYMAWSLKQLQSAIAGKREKVLALKRVKHINSIFYTYLPNQRNISYRKLGELLGYCQLNGITCEEFDQIKARHYFYDKVAQTEESEAEVYDLSVPGSHSFIANGFINHNSTYLRQVALISLMAQLGSFVPAKEAKLPIIDKIFTRVGASDMLAFGYSTFMVEMLETANILNNATEKSLVILDEMGRGTSTFDGVSIAWAVAEHLVTKVKAKTLFATHYHELTLLEEKLEGVKNMNVLVKEYGDQVIFLHKVAEGKAEGSYGVHVAKLAGLPKEVTDKASEVLHRILQGNPLEAIEGKKPLVPKFIKQKALFGAEPHPVIEELKKLDINSLTPIEALNLLGKLKEKL